MGAPKQKWTAEEEAALKAGIHKHGKGKWRTILTDPDFSTVLQLRSNVDLKDKWRNINVTAIWGSRQKAKLALENFPQTPKRDENPKVLSTIVQGGEAIVDAKPLATCSGTLKNTCSKEQLARLDNLILEAIAALKEPCGSDRASIALYIQEKHRMPPNLKKILAGKLKHLAANGKLIKIKQKYKIARSSTNSEGKTSVPTLVEERKPKKRKSQVDEELLKNRGMSVIEAAAAAAKAVAVAEAAIAEAEVAATLAQAAEAQAEAAQVFAEAAMKAFNSHSLLIA